MIRGEDLYGVLCAVVPLYFTMFLAYASVKWWKIFSPQQCTGINRFVAFFAVPLLSMDFISRIDPYKMNFLFIAADSLSKIFILLVLLIWARVSEKGSLEWAITGFSLSTLPNTLVMGIPLLKSMYGDDKEGLMIQAVVLQCIVWYTILLFLFEFREARIKVNSSRNSEAGNMVVTTTTATGSTTAPPNTEAKKVVPPDSGHFGRILTAMVDGDGKEVHLFVWRCGCCISQGLSPERLILLGKVQKSSTSFHVFAIAGAHDRSQVFGKEESKGRAIEKNIGDVSSSVSWAMISQILKTVSYKLLRNPNSYASLVGLSWALISCRWGIKKPEIVDNSVTILSKAGLGMAMFSLGLFMALQTRIIACGKRMAIYGMVTRFVAGPAVMAMASLAVGLRGTTFKVSIVQAALPQGIVPFVFAREYDLHPHVLSTAVIFGMIVSLPITILYYILLGL